jgi:hypothetical protein
LGWILGNDEDRGDRRFHEHRLAIAHALSTGGHAAQNGQNLKL